MTRRSRSHKANLRQLREELEHEGWTTARIAERIQADDGVNRRVAMRLACGLTQAEVAKSWNVRWPDSGPLKAAKQISYWEAWPGPTGRMPSLETLGRLACLYRCQPGDLLDPTDYGHLDLPPANAGNPPSVDAPPAGLGSTVAPLAVEPARELLPAQAPTDHLPDLLLPRTTDCFSPAVPPAEPFLTRLTTQLANLSTIGDGSETFSARQKDAAFKQLVDTFIDWAHTMNRRVLLRHVSWAAAIAAVAPLLFDGLPADEQARLAAAIRQESRVDDTVVDHIDQVLSRCVQLDETLGPQAALDTLLAQRQLTYALLANCPSRLRPRLLSVFANLTRHAGWMTFNLRDFDGANHYYEQARTAAHEAHDTALGAMVLCNLSQLATWQHRPRVGIDHAVAAQAWAVQTNDLPVRSYAADVAARAYAMDQQDATCRRHLDQARDHIAGYTDGATLVLSRKSQSQQMLDSVEGMCLLQLGHPEQAVQHTSRALAALDRSYVRVVAFTTVDLSKSHLAGGDVEAAAGTLGDAAGLAAQNQSPRLVQDIRDVRGELTPWHDTEAVRQLDDRLRGYGLT